MTQNHPMRFALVAGGGTAGHVVPALAVARALQARRGPSSVELVGSRRGMEATLVDGEEFPVTLLGGRGMQRRADMAALAANARAFGELLGALAQALVLVARRRPAVVVSVGGYASIPAAVAAIVLGTPVVVCNVDAVPGLANRLIGRVARASAVAYPGTRLPRAVVTGAPVPVAIAALAGTNPESRRLEARQVLAIPEGRAVVVVVGGSLGARHLNEAVLQLAGSWAERSDVAIYHVVGARDASWAAEQAEGLPGRRGGEPGSSQDTLWYRQVAYEDRMPLVYLAADVVVARAGAMTVAELSIVGLPAVLVPLPGSPGDHQGANAAMLVRAGAAVVLPDTECDGAALAAQLDELLADPERRRTMASAGARLGRPDAAEVIASLAEAHARPGWTGRRRR